MYIFPKVDLAFKKLFGVEENKDLLISLINSIVSEADQVADIELLNPYNPKSFKDDKLSILDVKAKGISGKLYNIEVQINDVGDYDKRALYYWAKLYAEQLRDGEDYSNLSKAIGIHILNFYSIAGTDKYHNAFYITEKETGLNYFQDLELHTIELKKFSNDPKEGLTEIAGKVKTALDRWTAFLSRHDLLKAGSLPKELNAPELNKALQVLEVMSFNQEERELYEGQIKWLRDEASALKKAEEKGMKKGIEKGRKEGIEKERKEGIEKEKINTAIRMFKDDVSLELVQRATGLSKEQLIKLKNNL